MKIVHVITFSAFCALNACSSINYPSWGGNNNHWSEGDLIYPEGYENNGGMSDVTPQDKKVVAVPDSYYVGSAARPVSHKDDDRGWMSNQNPNSYTIELAHDEKASHVANVLLNTPKTDRSAQLKYQQSGKTYYKGLYGSYSDRESAQKALDALPDTVKQNAKIESWGQVQQNTAE